MRDREEDVILFREVATSKEIHDKYVEWLSEQNRVSVEIQKSKIPETDPFYEIFCMCWEDGMPYTGAIGGEITYTVTPTSLGLAVKAKHCITENEFELTDFGSW